MTSLRQIKLNLDNEGSITELLEELHKREVRPGERTYGCAYFDRGRLGENFEKTELGILTRKIGQGVRLFHRLGNNCWSIAPFVDPLEYWNTNYPTRWYPLIFRLLAVLPVGAQHPPDQSALHLASVQASSIDKNLVFSFRADWYMASFVQSRPILIQGGGDICGFLCRVALEFNQEARLKDPSLFDRYALKTEESIKVFRYHDRNPLDPTWDPMILAGRVAWLIMVLEGVWSWPSLLKSKPKLSILKKENTLFKSHPHIELYWLWATWLTGEAAAYRSICSEIKKRSEPKTFEDLIQQHFQYAASADGKDLRAVYLKGPPKIVRRKKKKIRKR